MTRAIVCTSNKDVHRFLGILHQHNRIWSRTWNSWKHVSAYSYLVAYIEFLEARSIGVTCNKDISTADINRGQEADIVITASGHVIAPCNL